MKISRRTLILAVVVLVAGVRLWRLDLPFLEPYNSLSRQAMCASVARNFYRHGMNILRPELDENGRGPSIYNVEFPFYSWLMAVGYFVAGGVREWAARLVSVLFSLIFLGYFYGLARRSLGEAGTWGAVLLAAFSPLALALSRSVQPDMAMVAATAGAAFHFWAWLDQKKPLDYWASALWMTFAVATKIHAAHLAIPLIYLASVRRERLAGPAAWGYALCVSIALLWYAYMAYLGRTLQLPYQPYHYLQAGQPVAELFSAARIGFVAKVFGLHLLTPAGGILFAAGLLIPAASQAGRWARVWLAAALIYLAIAWPYTTKHAYYQMALLIPVALIAGEGLDRIWKALASARLRAVCAAALVLAAALPSLSYYRGIYFIPENLSVLKEAGQVAERLLPEDALVLAAYGSSPAQLYYCDRKGWVFDPGYDDATLLQNLETRRRQGATHFVTTQVDWLTQRPAFTARLRQGRMLAETKSYWVVELA